MQACKLWWACWRALYWRDHNGHRQTESKPFGAYDTGMPTLPTFDATALASQLPHDASRETVLATLGEHISMHLAQSGACWIAHWPPAELASRLRADLLRLQSDALLDQASVGRQATRQQRSDVRGDSTCWLDDPRCGPAAAEFLAALDQVRATINRQLFLGITEIEAHYAAYPAGTGYTRHRDRFRDSDARVVSWVSYLNPEWHRDDGGALRLYMPSDSGIDTVIDRPPSGGSICFLSELQHEVLTAHRGRYSIAGWFRRRAGDLP